VIEEAAMTKIAVGSPARPDQLPVEERARQAKPRAFLATWLAPLASLRLTVVLFLFAIALVFFGTLAQVDEGIWTVLSKYFRAGIAWIPLQVLVRFGQVFLGVSPTAHLSGSFPFPGGWLTGGLLLANLLAAHLVRFKLSWKRSGILLIHAGLVVMMLSELVTGLFAVEGRMTIEQKGSSNFTEDFHSVELAVVDRSDPKMDDVTVVPGTLLRRRGRISDPALPFDLQTVRYMSNSAPSRAPEALSANVATAGDGLSQVMTERREAGGADTDQALDLPSAYVTLFEKGSDRSLGTYLVSLWWSALEDRPQHVKVGDKTYDVCLRFQRRYKPYTIELLEFRHEKYLGTDTPRNFSSRVRLVDPERHEDRQVLIYMNNPMRHAGETFYQSSFLPGDTGTVLQVVRNPGWLMPYLACIMVSVGMLFHFGLHLTRFLLTRPAQ
jgi:hypothetical protein